MSHIHASCGGELVFHHTEKTPRGKKYYYKCQRCGQIVNCILWASYDELVMRGQIRVSKEEYRYIKEKYRR